MTWRNFSQMVNHTIYGPGNPISLSARIEPAAIGLCHKIKKLWNKINIFVFHVSTQNHPRNFTHTIHFVSRWFDGLWSVDIALNYSLIITKYHIFASSISVGSLDFDSLLLRLKDKLGIIRSLTVKNKELDQFKETWAVLLWSSICTAYVCVYCFSECNDNRDTVIV